MMHEIRPGLLARAERAERALERVQAENARLRDALTAAFADELEHLEAENVQLRDVLARLVASYEGVAGHNDEPWPFDGCVICDARAVLSSVVPKEETP